MKFGYARVSTKSQKHDLQVDAFLKEGIKPKNIYADISSGAKAERKGLDELLSILREGDTLVVWKLDRIARSLSHLTKLIEDFEKKGIHQSHTHGLMVRSLSPESSMIGWRKRLPRFKRI
jgi:DNA invertase Pin-like site-specific DNA recombinase